MLRTLGAWEKILARAYENKAAREAGQTQTLPHKIKIYGTGNGSCCVRLAAMLELMSEFELTDVFYEFDTISGAGGPAVGYVTGHADKTIELFLELIKRGVLYKDPVGWKQASINLIPRINVELYEKVLASYIDQERLAAYIGEVHVVAAKVDGSPVRLDLKRGNAAKLIAASSAFPIACSGVETAEHGVLYDGLCAGRIIPHEDMEGEGEIDNILVLQSRVHNTTLLETYGWTLLIDNAFKTWVGKLKENLRGLDTEFQKTDKKLTELNRRGKLSYARFVPSNRALDIGPTETRPKWLMQAADETRFEMRKILTACKPQLWV